jgi:dipeptidyl aminopeptidase/acylaminoacyl peptidase
MRTLLRFVALSMVAVLSITASAQKRPITEKDLFSFAWIGDSQLSPDGSSIAFVQATVTANRDGYQTAIYLLDLTKPGATPQTLTSGPRDTSPRWSPDGKQIVFLRSVEKEGKFGPAQLYLKAVNPHDPGDPAVNPVRLTDLPKGASSPTWSPKGDLIAVESMTPQDQDAAKLEAARKARATGDDAHVSDVRIVNRNVYRMNGEGNLDSSLVPQLYIIYPLKADGTQPAPWQITGGRFGAEQYVWSPHSDWIFYTSLREDEPYYDPEAHNSIYGVQVESGETHPKGLPETAFTADLKVQARGISISHDGAHFAFHAAGHPAKPVSHQQGDLMVLDLAWNGGKPSVSGEPRNLTAKLDYEMGSGVGGDNTAPRGAGRSDIVWSADNSHLTDVAGRRGSALLVAVDARTGALTELTQVKQAVVGFTSSADEKTLVALVSNPLLIGDLFTIGADKAQTQLTHSNDALFSQLDLSMPEEMQVTPTVHPNDIKGQTIDTFVQLPPGFDAKQKYPLILNIHGGPHSAYGWIFDHEMLWMAARGYVVVYPNPRGSTTYGQNFANIIQDNYPNDDFHDLMDSVDAVVKLGYVDPSRMGVTGGSGGGLLTDWTVTQTNRFKAAVAQRDIVDWAGWWYTADIGDFHQFWMKPAPFDNLQAYHDRSPLTYVNNIKTPMMFILGDADYRTPPTSGGEVFFRALKYKKIPTVMVRFPRESHELSRSGEPWHRVERLENIISWFDKFLMNVCEPQYDVAPAANSSCKVK